MRPLFLFAIYSVAFAGVTIFRATADANNPAHELAQKFAAESAPKTETVKSIAAEPAGAVPAAATPSVLEQMAIKPVVANPAFVKPAPSKPSPANVANPKPTPANLPATPAPAAAAPTKAAPKLAQAKPVRPPAPGVDYERDMLDAARAEAEARQQLQMKKKAESAPPPAATPAAAPAAAQPAMPAATPAPASEPAAPSTIAPAAGASPQAAAPPPAVPAKTPAAIPQIKIEAKVNVPAPSVPAVISRPDGAPRASILVVLTNHTQAGRRVTPPDPVICLSDVCYISEGVDREARVISRSDALSTKNTVMAGAGACKGTTRCAFRGVSMKPGDEIEIVDLGLVGHDKREGADMEPDKTCRMDGEFLSCDRPATAPDYRIWAVPEMIAASAGPAAIESALADDLPEEDMVQAGDK